MSLWQETTLGKACELYQPKTISSADLVDDGDYPVYGANGVIGKYDKFNHADPQLLITCRGATCGAVNISQPNSWINGNAMVVKPRDSSIELRYLKHLFRGGVDLTAVITGAAQPQITRQSLAPLKVRFPPLTEQHRIAAILDQADLLRAKRRKALVKLDGLTQSIFIEMFGDPITNPLAWTRRFLGEITERVTKGESPKWQGFDYQDDGALFVTSENVRLGEINLSSPKYIPLEFNKKLNRSQLKEGDLLVNLVGASIGRSCIFPGWSRPANVNQAVGVISVNSKLVESTFLAAFLLSEGGQKILLGNRVEAARANISLADLRKISVPLPPLTNQYAFISRTAAVEKLKNTFRASLTEFDILFNSLQYRAFRGEL